MHEAVSSLLQLGGGGITARRRNSGWDAGDYDSNCFGYGDSAIGLSPFGAGPGDILAGYDDYHSGKSPASGAHCVSAGRYPGCSFPNDYLRYSSLSEKYGHPF